MSTSETTQPNYVLTRETSCYCCDKSGPCTGVAPVCKSCGDHLARMPKIGSDDRRSIRRLTESQVRQSYDPFDFAVSL